MINARFFGMRLLSGLVLCSSLIGLTAGAETLPLNIPPEKHKAMEGGDPTPSAAVLRNLATELTRRYPGKDDTDLAVVDVRLQRMYLLDRGRLVASYPVSTSARGIGNLAGSDQTPVGVFRVAEKFGSGAPLGTIFKARRDTGQVARILTNPDDRSEGDLVTTRILWLTGLQPGFNHGGDVDTHARYIYIHGTPEEGRIGTPSSHGCVRMGNADVVKVFRRLPVGSLVYIASGEEPLTSIPGPKPK